MKKIMFTILLVLGSIGVYAQTGPYVGFSGALNNTWIIYQHSHGLTQLQYESKWGPAVALTGGFNFMNIGIQTELRYSRQGQNYGEIRNGTEYERSVNLDYIQIPLLARFMSGSGTTRFYIEGGPQLGLLQRAEIYNRVGNSENTVSGEEARNRYENTEVALAFGLGAQVRVMPNLFLTGGMRFNYGLTDINAEHLRRPDESGIYNPSRNALGGLNIGINYTILPF